MALVSEVVFEFDRTTLVTVLVAFAVMLRVEAAAIDETIDGGLSMIAGP